MFDSRVWHKALLKSVRFMTIFLLVTACVGAPPKKPNLIEEAKKQSEAGSQLATKVETKLKIKEDPIVGEYLQKLARVLEQTTEDPRLANTDVVIIEDRNSIWRSLSIPGHKIYLSLGWLKTMQTDSEVAALIALELGHIQQMDVLTHLKKLSEDESKKKNLDFFGEKGLFTYNKSEMEGAIGAAVGVLYTAGFDSRAEILNFEAERKFSEHSIFSENMLDAMIQMARDAVDSHPPLIDPIVRTPEFPKIRKRIQKL